MCHNANRFDSIQFEFTVSRTCPRGDRKFWVSTNKFPKKSQMFLPGLDVTVLSRIVETVKAPREYVANPRPYTEADTEKEFLKRGEEMFKSFASRKFILRDCLQYEVPLWVKIFKMREDAVPTPTIKWERPASGKQHIYQVNEKPSCAINSSIP